MADVLPSRGAAAVMAEPLVRGDGWVSRRAVSAALPILVVLGASLLNTVRSYDVGFNLADEGFAMLIAEQMLHGRALYRDLFGYNPIWHLSHEALFAVFGVDFLAFRLFHLALATLAAIFG